MRPAWNTPYTSKHDMNILQEINKFEIKMLVHDSLLTKRGVWERREKVILETLNTSTTKRSQNVVRKKKERKKENTVLHRNQKKIHNKGVVAWKDGCLSIQWKWPFIPQVIEPQDNKISYRNKKEDMNIAIKPKGASLSWGSHPKNKQLGSDPK